MSTPSPSASLELKDRINYAYEHYKSLKDLAVIFGVFFITTMFGIVTAIINPNAPRYMIGWYRGAGCAAAILTMGFFLTMGFKFDHWMRKHKSTFKAAELDVPPLYVLGALMASASLISVVLFWVFFLNFAFLAGSV